MGRSGTVLMTVLCALIVALLVGRSVWRDAPPRQRRLDGSSRGDQACVAWQENAEGGRRVCVDDERAREPAPRASMEDMLLLSKDNAAFAFELLHGIGGSSNLVYSPYSISMALAMVFAGARGDTERGMARTLHFSQPQNVLHAAFNGLAEKLVRPEPDQTDQQFSLTIANAIWGKEGLPFEEAFLDVLSSAYGAGLRLLDFGRSDEARDIVNEWVARQTHDRITDMIPEGRIDAQTMLILVNAVYFKAKWESPFDPAKTRALPFWLVDGTNVSVPMMTQEAAFDYADGAGYQAVELPYRGKNVSMVVILPDVSTFPQFEESFSATKLSEVLINMKVGQKMRCTMPLWSFTSSLDLSRILSDLGMSSAFGHACNFSGMCPQPLCISDVLHKAFIKVDETETEAAAATAVIMTRSLHLSPMELTLDRPFLFVVYDRPTATVLFVGRVLNPSAS